METITDKNAILGNITMDHAAKCRNKSGESIMQHFTIEFTGCTLGEVLQYAVSTCTISGQRAWEKYTADELNELVNGNTFHAKTIGRKIKSDAEIKAEYKARFNAASPEVKQQMLDELQSMLTEA